MKHVLFLLTSADEVGGSKRKAGSYLPEIAHPWHELTSRGVAVEFASLAGGTPPEYGYEEKDEVARAFRTGPAYARLRASRPLRELDPHGYDAVFVPGGLGPMVDLVHDALAKKTLAAFFEAGKVVGAVCHGPAALLDVKLSDGTYLVAGKHVAAFSDEEEKVYAVADVPFLLSSTLAARGAVLDPAAPWQARTVVDGRLVTGQNPASASGVGKAIAQLLGAA
jgi:putative intracellular protease/amidase